MLGHLVLHSNMGPLLTPWIYYCANKQHGHLYSTNGHVPQQQQQPRAFQLCCLHSHRTPCHAQSLCSTSLLTELPPVQLLQHVAPVGENPQARQQSTSSQWHGIHISSPSITHATLIMHFQLLLCLGFTPINPQHAMCIWAEASTRCSLGTFPLFLKLKSSTMLAYDCSPQ